MSRILLPIFSIVCGIIAIARCIVLPHADGLGVNTLYFVLAAGAILMLQQIEKLKILDWELTLRKATEVAAKATARAEEANRKTDALNEVLPLSVNPHAEKPKRVAKPGGRKSNPEHPDDPQKGRWGGISKHNDRELVAEPIRALIGDPDNFSIPLVVRSTNKDHPLPPGKVKFHVHDSFIPDVIETDVVDGVARITLVAYGAFTVGVETSDSSPTQLELDLADANVDAPPQFKDS